MTRPDDRDRGRTLLVVALLGTLAVALWLAFGDGPGVGPGFAGGAVAMTAAALACLQASVRTDLPRRGRAFWCQQSAAAGLLAVAATIAAVVGRNRPGIAPLVAVPLVIGVLLAVASFLYLPLGRRTALTWLELLLDGAIMAVSGSLIFFFVVADLSSPDIFAGFDVAAAAVGVAGLVAAVVVGKAALAPEGPVEPAALRLLAIAPLVAVVAVIAQVGAAPELRRVVSVLTLPVVAAVFAGAACLATGRRPTAAPTSRNLFTLLPFLAVTVAAALVGITSIQHMGWHERTILLGTVLAAALVVLRQLIGLRRNQIQLRDIRRQRAELEHLAMHDALTGLANRNRFGDVLADRLDRAMPTTVLLMDIDDFKMVNDSLGHDVGDALLVQVAHRLHAHSRGSDLVARLGGDEFAVMVPASDGDGAAQRFLAALAEPFRVGEDILLANASVGVAPAEPGATVDDVLSNADIAMYAAKAEGKSGWARFEPGMRHEIADHARLASELHHGLHAGELVLLYQPVFDLATGRINGAEALVRWQHPQRGLVAPDDFIPVAERSGLIVQLGSWVLRTACAQLAAWRAEHGEHAIGRINVNVAVRQLRDTGFVDEVLGVLTATGLTPDDLIVEVTESSVADGRQVRDTLRDLHEHGIRIALDDFGTGQSSLSLLRAFPVDVLKLDKSFVDGICDGDDPARQAIASAVAHLTEQLGLYAVAEGIEDAGQLSRLREMGYRYGQGFLLARPLTAEDTGALMAAPARESVAPR
jgi:diguanylate cyclase (GGDEF)-like protein